MAEYASSLRAIALKPCPVHREPMPITSADGSTVIEDPWLIVEEAAKEDFAMRHRGVTGGLYDLASLKPFRRLSPGVPTIVARNPETFTRAANDAEFRRRFQTACPVLANFDLKRYGFRVAGGAVSALTMRDAAPNGTFRGFDDFDLFLVGHQISGGPEITPAEASARRSIEALRDHIIEVVRSPPFSTRARKMYVHRTQGCITFWFSGGWRNLKPIQVILRLYSTAAEVIHGFDLGSSAFLWDGEKVWMTAMGKLAAEHGVNVLNLQARRASLERRISRYFERGFDIVLPGLDVSKLRESDGRLPYLAGGYGDAISASLCGCVRRCSHMYPTGPGRNEYGRPAPPNATRAVVGQGFAERDREAEASGYGMTISYGYPLSLVLHNIAILNRGGESSGLCAWTDLKSDVSMFDMQPTLTPEVVLSIANDAASHKPPKVSRLITLFGRETAARLVSEAILTGSGFDGDEIRALVNARVAELNPRAVIPFAFMQVEDNTALTGPFPRRVLSATKWFGEMYLPANEWRLALNGALVLTEARSTLSSYELLWILQWAHPAIIVLNEIRLLKHLETLREIL